MARIKVYKDGKWIYADESFNDSSSLDPVILYTDGENITAKSTNPTCTEIITELNSGKTRSLNLFLWDGTTASTYLGYGFPATVIPGSSPSVMYMFYGYDGDSSVTLFKATYHSDNSWTYEAG